MSKHTKVRFHFGLLLRKVQIQTVSSDRCMVRVDTPSTQPHLTVVSQQACGWRHESRICGSHSVRWANNVLHLRASTVGGPDSCCILEWVTSSELSRRTDSILLQDLTFPCMIWKWTINMPPHIDLYFCPRFQKKLSLHSNSLRRHRNANWYLGLHSAVYRYLESLHADWYSLFSGLFMTYMRSYIVPKAFPSHGFQEALILVGQFEIIVESKRIRWSVWTGQDKFWSTSSDLETLHFQRTIFSGSLLKFLELSMFQHLMLLKLTENHLLLQCMAAWHWLCRSTHIGTVHVQRHWKDIGIWHIGIESDIAYHCPADTTSLSGGW